MPDKYQNIQKYVVYFTNRVEFAKNICKRFFLNPEFFSFLP